MSDNDYVAEYVREKYPSILGIDFTLWKMGRVLAQGVHEIVDALRKGVDKYPGETEDILKKIKESGEEPETESDELKEITYEGECYNAER